MVRKPITIARKSGAAALIKRVAGLTKLSAYVGIPASNADREAALQELLGKATGKRKKKLQKAVATNDINNAEALFIFSKGSPLRGQAPRPVLEPAIQAEDNKKKITDQISASIKASLQGDTKTAKQRMTKAALAGQNAARSWFTDARNNWAPNTPATIAAKGSDRPGIDTGSMRSAIIGLVKEE